MNIIHTEYNKVK